MAGTGIQKTEDHHIDKRRQPESHGIIRDKANAGQSDLVLSSVSSLASSQVFADWFKQPEPGSRLVIGALDENLKAQLGARQKAVLLSDETLAKQKKHHPELTFDEYQRIPEIIQKGKVIKEKDERLYFFQRESRFYMAVVKATENKAENYLITFFRVKPEHMQRKQRRGELIRDWNRN